MNELIDRIVGSKGLFRAPAYWVRYILRELNDRVNSAMTNASVAKRNAERAQIIAEAAKETAEGIRSLASGAQSTASNAFSKAEAAQTTANTAKTTADNAQRTANSAQHTADSIKSTAESATTTANTAKTAANIAHLEASLCGGAAVWVPVLRYREANNAYPTLIYRGRDGVLHISQESGDYLYENNYKVESIYMGTITKSNVFFSTPYLKYVCGLVVDRALTSLDRCFNTSGADIVDLTGMDTSHIQRMEYMFCMCSCHKVELRSLDTNNVTTFLRMFLKCTNLVELDLSSFRATSAETIQEMFSDCSSLETLTFSSEAAWRGCVMTDAFKGCVKLTNFSGLNTDTSYSLSDSPLLNSGSVGKCVNMLHDLTEGGTVTDYEPQTLTLHPDVRAKVTDKYIQAAAAKGWTIA